MEDAASRLLRVLDERKERRLAGGQNCPAEIQSSSASLLEERPEASNGVIAQASGHTAALAREGADSGLRCGQVQHGNWSAVEESENPIACPPTDAGTIASDFRCHMGNVRRETGK